MTDPYDPDRSPATDKLPFGELEVDLREALSTGEFPAPRPAQPATYQTAGSDSSAPNDPSVRAPRTEGQRERQLDAAIAALQTRGLARSLTVAFGAVLGGAGTSSIAFTLADIFAGSSRSGVVVLGALGDDAQAAVKTNARRLLSDLHDRLLELNSPADCAPYLTPLPGGGSLLGVPFDAISDAAIPPIAFRSLVELLQRCFPLVLIDLEPGDRLWRETLSIADQFVAVTTATATDLRQVASALATPAVTNSDLAVTIAVNKVPTKLLAEIEQVLSSTDRESDSYRYLAIPADAQLERRPGPPSTRVSDLARPTRIALKRLAQDLISPNT